MRLLTSILLICFCTSNIQAQNKVITTPLPFLLVNPDARSNGFGNVTAVSSPLYSVTGLYGNPAVLNQGQGMHGIKVSYMPWLRALVPGMDMIDAGAYLSIGPNTTLGYNYHYLSLSSIAHDNSPDVNKPFKRSNNLRISHSFGENFSAGLGGKYFRSALLGKNPPSSFNDYQDVKSYALDFGFLYRDKFSLNEDYNFGWQLGLFVENLGPKVSYFKNHEPERTYAIPTNLNAGVLFTFPFLSGKIENLEIDIAYQVQRLLIGVDTSGIQSYLFERNPALGISNMDGSNFIHQLGSEVRYTIDEWIIATRFGHFNEHKSSGKRKYFTYGIGAGYKGIQLDLFYLTPLPQTDSFMSNPLQNTLSISLGANIILKDKKPVFSFPG